MDKILVLDHGYVELVDWMGDDLLVVNAARASSDKVVDELGPKEIKLLSYLAEHKHMSPFRHPQIHIRMSAPEFIMRQWYKHTIGMAYNDNNQFQNDQAWNEMSMRYTNSSKAKFYIPDAFRGQSDINRQCSEEFISDETVNQACNTLTQACVDKALSAYDMLIKNGVAKEQARMLLPLNIYTTVTWTTSLQAAINFILLRDHKGAQYEIQEYAKALRQLIEPKFPYSVGYLMEALG